MEPEDDAKARMRCEAAATRLRTFPDDADEIALHEQGLDEYLERLQARWAKTGNPLHVWAAIRECHHPGFPVRSLPSWVLHYLSQVATDFAALARLKDPTIFPEPLPGESAEELQARRVAWNNAKPISGTKAANLALHVLGLRQGTRNAFARAHADEELAFTALMDRYPDEAAPDRTARIQARHNLDSKRSVDRRLAKGRKLLTEN